MPSREKLSEFTTWCAQHITGDETFRSGTSAQVILDRQTDWLFLPAA